MKTAGAQPRSPISEVDASPRFLANTSDRKVHDQSRERPECQFCEIEIDHRVYFATLSEAHGEGFRDCRYCI
jgi:hypothetical protein